MSFYFKQKTAYEMRISDWSSDVCSSDLPVASHVGQDRLGGGMPACFGHAAVGLFRHPGDDQNFLGARHRDIEQPPMLLGRRQRRRLISRRERPVALVGGQREDGQRVPPRDVAGKRDRKGGGECTGG